MRIVVIGATGTIGSAVVDALSSRHEVVRVSHRHGEYLVDLGDSESIRWLFAAVGPVDGIVCAAGLARFGGLRDLTDADFALGIDNKLMGQVNVVRTGLRILHDNGCITLTSGVLATEPVAGSAAVSLANAGVEGFTRAAALEAPRGIRINAVSPPWVRETLIALGRDPGPGLPAATVARAYVESVESGRSGEVIDARTFA